MRVVVSGPVTEEHLENAELFAGITPTCFVTNGLSTPPASDRSTLVLPIEPLFSVRHYAIRARDYTLCQNADAVLIVGENEHLVKVANMYKLPVHQETV